MTVYRSIHEIEHSLSRVSLNTFILFCFFFALQAFSGNMQGNEVDLLPLARQYADKSWIPGDWYLNQPAGYRLVFQFIFGNLASQLGFLSTSIIGRSICFLLLSIGLSLIASKIKLNIIFLITALLINLKIHYYRGAIPYSGQYYNGILDNLIGRNYADIFFISLFLSCLTAMIVASVVHRDQPWIWCLTLFSGLLIASNRPYSIVANEWYVGGIEAKAVAYGFIFISIGLTLGRRYILSAAFFGISTSFHVLAGGYAALTYFLYLMLFVNATFKDRIRKVVLCVSTYLLFSAFSIPAVFTQLFSTTSISRETIASRIYVFVRLPHHLNPFSWDNAWILNLSVYLGIIIVSFRLLKRISNENAEAFPSLAERATETSDSVLCFFRFALLSLIPFFVGLIATPFDRNGSILQYYPFRFGDVMIPFATAILFALLLQEVLKQSRNITALLIRFFTVLFISSLIVVDLSMSIPRALSLRNFPNLDFETSELFSWVQANTESVDTFILPPSGLESFSWICERSTIVNLKMLPQSEQGIVEWSNRITDLMGGSESWKETSIHERGNVFNSFSNKVEDLYANMTSEYVEELMEKYKARFFVTSSRHEIGLSLIFRNQKYNVYTKYLDG